MSDVQRRVDRAVRDHGSFERREEGTVESVVTPLSATVDIEPRGEGRAAFRVRVRAPLLREVVEGHVADVVEDGWFETFERRIEDVGAITRGDHELAPTVQRHEEEAVVEFTFEEIDQRRGIDDANALITFVEGTYAQGIIPGYEYTGPAADLVESARRAGGSDTGV